MKEHHDFADRLNSALDDIGFPAKNHGRQTELAKAIKADQKTVRRWLEGDGFPRPSNMQGLAKLTKVSQAYLRFGQIDSGVTSAVPEPSITGNLGEFSRALLVAIVPLQEADYKMELSQYPLISCDSKGREDARASVVEGSSMAPDYPDGTRITWIPSDNPKSGDHVIAKLDSDARVFRVFDFDAGKSILRPINAQFSIIRDGFEVVGIAIEKSENIPNSAI